MRKGRGSYEYRKENSCFYWHGFYDDNLLTGFRYDKKKSSWVVPVFEYKGGDFNVLKQWMVHVFNEMIKYFPDINHFGVTVYSGRIFHYFEANASGNIKEDIYVGGILRSIIDTNIYYGIVCNHRKQIWKEFVVVNGKERCVGFSPDKYEAAIMSDIWIRKNNAFLENKLNFHSFFLNPCL